MSGEIRPISGVAKERRILHFISGYRRFKLIIIIYDEKSSLVDKRFEISNLELIRDTSKIIKMEEVFHIIGFPNAYLDKTTSI